MTRRTLPAVAAGVLALLVARTASANGIAKGPYLMKPTTSGITVCWVSDAAAKGEVDYAPEEGSSPNAASREKEPRATRYHRVTLAGLQPYTRYVYRVSCQGSTGAGTFITAAPPGHPFKFVAYGDNRTQPQVHAQVLAGIMRYRPDFIINTGDQVANGSDESQWDEFWNVVQKALSQTAYYPALGNHEGHGAPYFRFFDVPAEYSFDYGDAHFVALDSNRSESEWRDQERWLQADLAAHQAATWRIVFFHHTPYTCVDIPRRRILAETLRARLEPIFLAEHVQLVLNGHDHCYQHHYAKGIHYVVTGGGGAPLYDVTPDTPYVKVAKKAHHYCELAVSSSAISLRAVGIDGAVIDSFSIPAARASASAAGRARNEPRDTVGSGRTDESADQSRSR